MSHVTERISTYISNKGINLAKLASETGIPYMSVYKSLSAGSGKRPLRDHEFLKICEFLNVNPMDFADKS